MATTSPTTPANGGCVDAMMLMTGSGVHQQLLPHGNHQRASAELVPHACLPGRACGFAQLAQQVCRSA